MNIRKLKLKDAPLMLEWMHDTNVIHDLTTDFLSKTIKDAENFINDSSKTLDNIHFAIASDSDEYMGTVSLKHIDACEKNAEFAISVRSKTMGKGYSWFGMNEIILYGFEKLDLNSIYWCVSQKNIRAIKFYDKHGFQRTANIPAMFLSRYKGIENLIWYSVFQKDYLHKKAINNGIVANCRIVKIKTPSSNLSGNLSFFESKRDVPFDIRRLYYIWGVEEGEKRGFHAHKKLKQMLFCPYGKIQLILDDGDKREEISLNDPTIGVIIEHPVWREMIWIEKNSVLCVVASDYYDENDYIRSYSEFKEYVRGLSI